MKMLIWFAEICGTVGGICWIFLLFRTIFSKENFNAMFDKARNGMTKMTKNVGESIKNRKKKEKEPVVTIR